MSTARRRGGILATAKHFPGHGDTDTDSHRDLPVLAADRARLARGRAGAVPAGGRGRRRRRHAGAHRGAGGRPVGRARHPVAGAGRRDAARRAGLHRPDRHRRPRDGRPAPGLDRRGGGARRPGGQRRAAAAGRQPGRRPVAGPGGGRRASSPRRGSTPRCAGCSRSRRGWGSTASGWSTPTRSARRWRGPRTWRGPNEVAAAAITLVRNDGGILPLAAERPLRIFHLALASGDNRAGDAIQRAELAARRVPFESRALGREVSAATADEIVAAAAGFTHVVVSAFGRGVAGDDGLGGMPRAQLELVRRLDRTGVPVILVSLGSPYVLRYLAEVPAQLCAYGAAPSSQRAAVAALFGEIDVTGTLPVTPAGALSQRPRHPARAAADDARAGRCRGAPPAAARRRRADRRRPQRLPRAAGVPGRGPGGRAARRAGPAAPLRPAVLRRRSAGRGRRHDLRPGQPDQGRRHHHHGDDPGGRGPAGAGQAGARLPAALHRRRQGPGDASATC